MTDEEKQRFAIENLLSELPHMDNRNLLNALQGASYDFNFARGGNPRYLAERIGILYNEVLARMEPK